MNASDWFKNWVEEVILDVIVKARETELEVESEDVTEMLQSHDKALMDKEMRKKKKKWLLETKSTLGKISCENYWNENKELKILYTL